MLKISKKYLAAMAAVAVIAGNQPRLSDAELDCRWEPVRVARGGEDDRDAVLQVHAFEQA